MKSAAKHEEMEMLRIAANFRPDYTIPHLMQLIGYRQRLAQEMLKGVETPSGDLDYVNNQIKLILGL